MFIYLLSDSAREGLRLLVATLRSLCFPAIFGLIALLAVTQPD
jgi:hypothetical protein